MIEQICQWAESEDLVRGALLVGSRGGNGLVDEWSDYDISLFCEEVSPFLEGEGWLRELGEPWVCVHQRIGEISTRLVIFEPGVKVDFAFYPVGWGGVGENFKVLVNKDGLEWERQIEVPLALDDEFWFEVFHVVNYLKRGDAWKAQSRLQGILDGPFLPRRDPALLKLRGREALLRVVDVYRERGSDSELGRKVMALVDGL